MRTAFAIVLLSVALTQPLAAQATGEPDRGLRVARELCATCHAVAKGDARSPRTDAPNFSAIAAVPGMTGMALNAALQTAHRERTMPHLMLPPEDLADVVAYILSLK